jgi:hypothetical protein
MSVHVVYRGAFGNNLFQYICARLFAEENGLRLETPWQALLNNGKPFDHESIVYMLPQNGGDVCEEPVTLLGDQSGVLDRKWPKGRYVLDGYFQKAKWYYDRRERILSFARLKLVQARPPWELVANVRLGDYVTVKKVIDPSWYHSILERLKFDRLYMVTDSPNCSYFDEFKLRYGATVLHQGISDDFNVLREFDRVICANGTFSWWATFFSGASKVYTFKRWIDDPKVELDVFPKSESVDGKFMHELQSP